MGVEKTIHISEDVISACAAGLPIVALESAVIAHGLPSPENLRCAVELESIIRRSEAIPATIAILDGAIRVGLSEAEINRLAERKGIAKINTSDIPNLVRSKLDGATTVSATAFIAHLVGIEVLVTGGIGGVHRGSAESYDVSADLWELTKSDVIVVCSGAKAILDLQATLEWLETHQVPVLGFGTDEFPGFYSRKTKLKVDRVNSVQEIAQIAEIRRGLGMHGGMIVAVPIPKADALEIDDVIRAALSEAEDLGKTGKELTPWVLARIAEMTNERSVVANVALLRNNALVGAQIAVALKKTNPKKSQHSSS